MEEDEDSKKAAAGGTKVDIEVGGVGKLSLSASDKTLSHFLPGLGGGELAKLREGLIRDAGKRLRKKVAQGDFTNLDPLERVLFGQTLGDLVEREAARLQNRLDTQAAIEEE